MNAKHVTNMGRRRGAKNVAPAGLATTSADNEETFLKIVNLNVGRPATQEQICSPTTPPIAGTGDHGDDTVSTQQRISENSDLVQTEDDELQAINEASAVPKRRKVPEIPDLDEHAASQERSEYLQRSEIAATKPRQWKSFHSDEELQRNQVNAINKYQRRMEFDAERTQLKIPTLQQRNECQLEQVPEEPVQFQRQDIFRPYEPRAESHEFQSRTQGDIDRDHRPIYEQPRRRWGTEQVHTATSNGQVRNEQEFALAVDRAVENAMRRLPSSGSGSQKNTPIKLPPFNGKESWKIWFNRFAEIAERQQWNDNKCLDEMLPKLQGDAGEFVFGHLPKRIRSDYQLLVSELENRFRKVETTKAFSAQFSHRNQRFEETPEEYAAELKRLYNKAYPERSTDTRREDLIRRFLNGLIDDQTRFHVEYIKDPRDIDEAVFEVINFAEVHKRKSNPDIINSNEKKLRKPTRVAKEIYSEQIEDNDICSWEDNTQPEFHAARVPISNTKSNQGQKKYTVQIPEKSGKLIEDASKANPELGKTLTDVLKCLEKMETRLETLEKSQRQSVNKDEQGNRPPVPWRGSITCFRCGESGHISRGCTNESSTHQFKRQNPLN